MQEMIDKTPVLANQQTQLLEAAGHIAKLVGDSGIFISTRNAIFGESLDLIASKIFQKPVARPNSTANTLSVTRYYNLTLDGLVSEVYEGDHDYTLKAVNYIVVRFGDPAFFEKVVAEICKLNKQPQ